MATTIPEPVDVLGVPIHPVTRPVLIDELLRAIEGGATVRAFYVNAHGLRLAQSNEAYRRALRRAELVFCDGFGAKLVAAILGKHIPERMTPPDWVDELLAPLAKRGGSVYLLGDEPGVADACAKRMLERHPGLQVAGSAHGYFEVAGPENDRVVEAAAGADLLLVGMGSPRQELWTMVEHVRLGAGCVLTVGALFRYYVDAERRAPRWMSNHGLEWVGRLVRHPLRHFDRYVVGLPSLIARALRARAGR